ncbi:MAG: ABC transporter ATP-binding protein [Deltaproteobacteria bacterium]|nr:ABC transporter ATP-binding protein [Deltaproteobacteria bacterium]
MIAVRDLYKQYATPQRVVRALSGISFVLAEGGLCAIVGPSGSGKSTLLGLLGGLDSPTSGEVHVGPFALHRMSPAQRTRFRAARVGFVFQSSNLVPVLTAAENVALPLTLLRLSARERSLKVDTLLHELGLREVAHHRPAELSGGQQQRVGIARALVTAPALVLADEPTAHLDSRTGRDVMDVLQSMHRGRSTTFIFSTHDPAVESIADERIALRDGMIMPTSRGCKNHGDTPQHLGP